MDDRGQRFTALAREVGQPVRSYLRRRARPDDVDDVLAEVFLVLWRRLDDVPRDAPLAWSYRVAANCLANHTRAARRRRDLQEKVARLDPPRSAEVQVDTEAFPEVYDALGALSDLDREIVTLWAWEQLRPAEIATVLDATPSLTANAVSVRLTRIKATLRERLERIGAGPDTDTSEGSADGRGSDRRG